MKDSPWFRHDSNAARDPKMLRLRATWGAEGYGVFWLLAEVMHEQAEGKILRADIGVWAVEFRFDKLKEFVEYCCDCGLYECDDDAFWSNRMVREKEWRVSLVEQRSAAGRASAARRATAVERALERPLNTNLPTNLDNLPTNGDVKTSEGQETNTIPYEDIIGTLNEETGRSYEWEGPRGERNRALIRALWKRGFRGPDFARVVVNKCRDWGRAPKPGGKDMRPYLRPQTLFQASKFEGYLNG